MESRLPAPQFLLAVQSCEMVKAKTVALIRNFIFYDSCIHWSH
jgi:hypothetical protein